MLLVLLAKLCMALAIQINALLNSLDNSLDRPTSSTTLSGNMSIDGLTIAGQKKRRNKNDERATFVCFGNRCRTISRRCLQIAPMVCGQAEEEDKT